MTVITFLCLIWNQKKFGFLCKINRKECNYNPNLIKLIQVWIVFAFFPIDLAPKTELFLFPDQAQEFNFNSILLWFNWIHSSIYMRVFFHLFYPFPDLSINISLFIELYYFLSVVKSNHVWVVVEFFLIQSKINQSIKKFIQNKKHSTKIYT